MELVAVVVAFGFVSWWAARETYARGRLAGIKEAMREMAGGIAAAHHSPGPPGPANVRCRLDTVKGEIARARGTARKADTIARALRGLGRQMGTAARLAGYNEGARPPGNEIRIDLPLRELLNIRWLAHAGFKLMMRNKEGDKFCFLNETDAQESNFALDRMEWSLSQAHKDPTPPHALALSRQQMICQRWPKEGAAPEAFQDAA